MSPQPNCLTPIILAGDSNLQYWPLSRKNRPLQFSREGGQLSLFQRTSQCAANNTVPNAPENGQPNADDNDIWVAVSARCLDIAREQLNEIGLSDRAKLFVEPVNRGSLNTLLALSLLIAARNRQARIVAIEAHRPPSDEAVFARLCLHYSIAPCLEQFVVLTAQRDNASAKTRCATLRINPKPSANNLCLPATVETVGSVSVGCRGVTFLSVKQFLASLSEGTQNIVGNCDSSVGNGYLLGDAMWPNLNQWSRLRKFSIDQFFAREQKAYRVRVVDLDGRVGEQVDQNTIAGPHYIQNSTNCDINGNAPLIIIDGCENISVTATSDAVLVRGPTASEDQTSLIAELEKNALRQLYEAPVRHHNWGDEIELERRPGFVMRKLIIHPGKSILPHLHNHRWESWQIISGVGRITIDTDSQLMKAGDYVPIPATIVHGLINIENEPLRILECRRGSYLTKVDHINVGEAPPLSPDLVSAHSDGTSASSPP